MNRILISVSDFRLCGRFVVDIALPRLRRFWGFTFALFKCGFAGIGKEDMEGVPMFLLSRFPCFVIGPLGRNSSPSMRQ